MAWVLGYTAYVVDFHLRHLSSGASKYESPGFAELRAALIAKYRRVMRPRTATTSAVYLGGSAAVSPVLNAVLATGIPKRLGRLPKMLGLKRQ